MLNLQLDHITAESFSNTTATRFLGNPSPKKKAILKLAYRLNEWAYNIFESGPYWAKEKATCIIDDVNRFISIFEDEFFNALQEHNNHFDIACCILKEALFQNDDRVFGACETNAWGSKELYPNLELRVLNLCLDLGIKAPPGFHIRFIEWRPEYKNTLKLKTVLNEDGWRSNRTTLFPAALTYDKSPF